MAGPHVHAGCNEITLTTEVKSPIPNIFLRR